MLPTQIFNSACHRGFATLRSRSSTQCLRYMTARDSMRRRGTTAPISLSPASGPQRLQMCRTQSVFLLPAVFPSTQRRNACAFECRTYVCWYPISMTSVSRIAPCIPAAYRAMIMHKVFDESDPRGQAMSDDGVTRFSGRVVGAGACARVARWSLLDLLAVLAVLTLVWPGVAQGGSSAGAQLSGEQLYLQHCAVCHGPDGEGTMPGVPDLTPRPGRLGQSSAVLVRKVMAGITGPDGAVLMPPGGGSSLTREQVTAIVEFMKRSIRN